MPLCKPNHLILIFYANDFRQTPYVPLEWYGEGKTPDSPNPWLPRLFYVLKSALSGKAVPLSWTADAFPFLSAVPAESNPLSNREYEEYCRTFVRTNILDDMKKGALMCM